MSTRTIGLAGVRGEFYAALETTLPRWVTEISSAVTGTDRSQFLTWIESEPGEMRWTQGGGSQVAGFWQYGIQVEHEPFEATVRFAIDDFRRDKTGQILLRARELAARSNQHWGRLIANLIATGETGIAPYDPDSNGMPGFVPEPYFFASHEIRAGEVPNVSNLLTCIVATPSDPTPAEFFDAVCSGVGAVIGATSHNLRPENAEARHFVVVLPINFVSAAGKAFNAPALIRRPEGSEVIGSIAGGYTVRFIVLTALPWNDRLAVFRGDGDGNAFIRSTESFALDQLDADSQNAFDTDEILVGVSSDRAAVYGKWQDACLVKFIST